MYKGMSTAVDLQVGRQIATVTWKGRCGSGVLVQYMDQNGAAWETVLSQPYAEGLEIGGHFLVRPGPRSRVLT